MAFIEWESKYSTLQRQLDEEHIMLFNIINELYKAMAIGQGPLLVGDILRKLYEYTCTHFRAEEEFMRSAGYDGLAEQLEQHKIFTDKLFELMKEGSAGKRIIHIDVALFLKEWITNHILKVDGKLRKIQNIQFNSTMK